MIEGRTLVLQGNGGNMTMSWQIAVCPIMATSEKNDVGDGAAREKK